MKNALAFLAVMLSLLFSGCASVTEQDLADLSSPNAIIKEKALLRISEEPGFPLNVMDFLVSRGNEEKAVNVLLNLLAAGKESKDVEVAIIKALGQLGQRKDVAWGAVVERLQDKDRGVRAVAIEVLGKTRNNKAATALLELLEKESDDYGVIWALGEIGTSEAVPTLNRLMTNEDPYTRYNAYKALEKIGKSQVEEDSDFKSPNLDTTGVLDGGRAAFQKYQDAMISVFKTLVRRKGV